jgi:uncharacterized protein YdhG (YjbR/CyaY superfamily)
MLLRWPDSRIYVRLHALLRSVAPDAGEKMKWNTPFHVELRFLFAFSAHKSYLNFTPNTDGLATFSKELESHKTTQGSLQVRYQDDLPEDLIRKIAEYRVWAVRKRHGK